VTLPRELAGVRVRAAQQDAYIQYASPRQINALLPRTIRPGVIKVEVSTPKGEREAFVSLAAVAPGFFQYRLNGKTYAVALFANSFVYVAETDALTGVASRPAKAGDLLQLYATGLGDTNPVPPDGIPLREPYPANVTRFRATIGGRTAAVLFVGMTYNGVFQVNLEVPNGLTGGEQPLVLFADNIASQPNLLLSIAN